MKSTHITDLSHELWPKGISHSEHSYHNGIIRQLGCQSLHFILESGKYSRGCPKLCDCLIHKKFSCIALRHTSNMLTDCGVDTVCFRSAEIASRFFTPPLILVCKCFFRMFGYTFTMPEFCHKVHPFLASIYAGRTCKQSIDIWENRIQQRNQIVFQNSLYLGILLILAIAVL